MVEQNLKYVNNFFYENYFTPFPLETKKSNKWFYDTILLFQITECFSSEKEKLHTLLKLKVKGHLRQV
jgi:hypothetical protein